MLLGLQNFRQKFAAECLYDSSGSYCVAVEQQCGTRLRGPMTASLEIVRQAGIQSSRAYLRTH
jgi:hypothetical protein